MKAGSMGWTPSGAGCNIARHRQGVEREWTGRSCQTALAGVDAGEGRRRGEREEGEGGGKGKKEGEEGEEGEKMEVRCGEVKRKGPK